MTREEFENIKAFAGRLPEMRQQVSDGQLLDHCEQALHDLIEAHGPVLDSRAAQVEWAKPGEVEILEPAHIKDTRPHPVPERPTKRSHHKKKS